MSETILTPDAITELTRREHELSESLRRAKARRDGMVTLDPAAQPTAREEHLLLQHIAALGAELEDVATQLDEALLNDGGVPAGDDWEQFQAEWEREAAARGEPDDLPF